MSANDLLFNPPILKKTGTRIDIALLKRMPLPFSAESMTGDGTDLLLTGRKGRIRYQEGHLTSQNFRSQYTLSPTYFAGRSAAISEDDGSVGVFYSQDGDSYYRPRGQKNPSQPFRTKANSLLQMTRDGLLLFEREPGENMGRLLYHTFDDSTFSDPFLPDEEISYFKPGPRGALALLERPFSIHMALITPDLQVKEIAVAAKDKYLFTPDVEETGLYLVEGRTPVYLPLSSKKSREEIGLLRQKPFAIWTQGETLVVVYSGWSVQLFKNNEEVGLFSLEERGKFLSVAACEEGLAARTESELLIFSITS